MVENIPRAENARKESMYNIHPVLILHIHGFCPFKPQKSSMAPIGYRTKSRFLVMPFKTVNSKALLAPRVSCEI